VRESGADGRGVTGADRQHAAGDGEVVRRDGDAGGHRIAQDRAVVGRIRKVERVDLGARQQVGTAVGQHGHGESALGSGLHQRVELACPLQRPPTVLQRVGRHHEADRHRPAAAQCARMLVRA
jgi:hypothetical protein